MQYVICNRKSSHVSSINHPISVDDNADVARFCQAWVCAGDLAESALPCAAAAALVGGSGGVGGGGGGVESLLLSPRTRKEFQCQFHPGTYRPAGVTVSSGMCNGWTCCKNKDEFASGCKVDILKSERHY